MHAISVVGVASPVPLMGHINLNGTNFILSLGTLSSSSSVNLKKHIFVSVPFHLYLFVFFKHFHLWKHGIFSIGIFLVISISFYLFESVATLVFIESAGGLAGIQLAIVFCVSVGSCNPASAPGGAYPNRQTVRCLMLPVPPAQSANGGVGRWERLENGWNKDTEKGIRIKV